MKLERDYPWLFLAGKGSFAVCFQKLAIYFQKFAVCFQGQEEWFFLFFQKRLPYFLPFSRKGRGS